MRNKRNPVKKEMDKFYKPKTQRDELKEYKKRKARDESYWNLDDELFDDNGEN